jgi:hypothetical protein
MQVCSTARHIHLPAVERNAMAHFNYRDSEHFVEKLNRYTTIEASQAFEGGRRPSVRRLLQAGAREFIRRYVRDRGFREGYRGFALAVMMSFYRMLAHIKLWEAWNNSADPVQERYDRIRTRILKEYNAPPLRRGEAAPEEIAAPCAMQGREGVTSQPRSAG